MSATPIILTGQWLEPDGSPSAGSVTASLTTPFSNGDESYAAMTRTAFLDVNGSLYLPVIANDDAGDNPSDGQWYTTIAIVGSPTTSGYITVPHAPEGSRAVTDAVLTLGSPTLSSATAAFTGGDVGAYVNVAGVPVGTTITDVGSSTTATLSAAATASGTALALLIGASASLADLLPA